MSVNRQSMLAPAAAVFAACVLAGAVRPEQPMEFEKHTVSDPVAVNKDAMAFLKPKGWKVDGGIKWYMNLWNQACLEVRVNNPNGLEQIETFPWAYCTWIQNPIVPMPRGSNYLGAIVEPPTDDPKEYVRRYTIPMLRRGATITGYQEMPEVAKSLTALNGGTKMRAGRTRIEYKVNGQPVEEDIYVSLYLTSFSLAMNSANILWGPALPPYGLRGAKGQLDAATPLMLPCVNSVSINPYWWGEWNYVSNSSSNGSPTPARTQWRSAGTLPGIMKRFGRCSVAAMNCGKRRSTA